MSEIPVAALDSHAQKLWESAQRALARGEDDRAMGLCREILDVAPGCVAVRRLHRSAALRRRGGGAGAVFAAVSSAPFLFTGKIVLGKDPTAAVRDAQRAIERNPRGVAAWRLLGTAAATLGWTETAVLAWETAHELEPDNLEDLVELGRVHLQAGRSDAAMESAGAALRLDSGHPGAQALLKAASVAQTMRRGRWGEEGDFRAKVRQPS